MPRSGTTFVEQILQAHVNVVCFQEFMALKSRAFAEFLYAISRSEVSARQMWSDSEGKHWRGYGSDEDRSRLFALALASLSSTTNSAYIAGKSPSSIKVVFCKTPRAELNLLALKRVLEFSYVHCVRRPVLCARSNWEMAWQTTSEIDRWIVEFGDSLYKSAKAFEAIRGAGVPVYVLHSEHFWQTAISQSALESFFAFVGLSPTEEVIHASCRHADPWPASRRRVPPVPFTERHADLLESHAGTRYWHRVFGL